MRQRQRSIPRELLIGRKIWLVFFLVSWYLFATSRLLHRITAQTKYQDSRRLEEPLLEKDESKQLSAVESDGATTDIFRQEKDSMSRSNTDLNAPSSEHSLVDLNNATIPVPLNTTCRCVDCTEDVECGGLWKGDVIGGDPHSFQEINIVVSHCSKPLEWLTNFIKGFSVKNITIISKCGKSIMGAPTGSTIVRLDNVGRCDHSYAYWIAERMKRSPTPDEEKEVVLFLKDNKWIHQNGGWQSMNEMLRVTSKTGFACGMKPTRTKFKINGAHGSASAFHDVETLKNFRIKWYYGVESQQEPFASNFSNFGEWAFWIGLEFPQKLTPVCYSGRFAATVQQMRKKEALWPILVQSLSRADNLEEGHFAERAWNTALSNPIPDYQADALYSHSHGIQMSKSSEHGPLLRHVKE